MRRIWLTMLLVACGGGTPDAGERPAALVRVATVEPGSLSEPWRTVGEVQALDDAALAVGADGPVARVLVREGDVVQQGELLLELDLSVAQAEAWAAQAAVDEADAELVRLQGALDRRKKLGADVLGHEALEDAQQVVKVQAARLSGRRAEAARAVAVRERQRLRAPFSGVVTSRGADPGDWVRAGDVLLTVVSTEAREVRAHVPAEIAARLAPGSPVALDGVHSQVIAVVPTLDASTRTALVRIAPAGGEVSGQVVDVTVPVMWEGRGVKVPRDALIADPEQARLVRVVDGLAEVVPVEILASTRTDALVEGEGLAAGDVVVVRGNERVRPGQAVRIEETGDGV